VLPHSLNLTATNHLRVSPRVLSNLDPKQWKRHALSHCQSSCHQFTLSNSENNQLLQLIIPGFIGAVHWSVAYQGRSLSPAQLILTGSWRWCKENRKFEDDVSQHCISCRVRDNIPHLLIYCPVFSDSRQSFTQSLVDLSIVKLPLGSLEETIEKALKDKVGTDLFSEFCKKILASRRTEWTRELDYLNGTNVSSLIVSLRQLFI
jgi:hypothetical protein